MGISEAMEKNIGDSAIEGSPEVKLNKERLTSLLKEAQQAHHAFEEKLGKPDENWQEWYAEYIIQHARQ